MRIEMQKDMCTAMCTGMCMDMCKGMCKDMPVETCIGMHVGMGLSGPGPPSSVQPPLARMHGHVCGHAYGHVLRSRSLCVSVSFVFSKPNFGSSAARRLVCRTTENQKVSSIPMCTHACVYAADGPQHCAGHSTVYGPQHCGRATALCTGHSTAYAPLSGVAIGAPACAA